MERAFYYPMSVHYSSAVWKIVMPNSGRKLVALALADMANDEGVCWPSIRSLSNRCNMLPDSIRGHLAALSAVGILRTEPQFKDGRQTSNLYGFAPLSVLIDQSTARIEQAEGGDIPGGVENGRGVINGRGRGVIFKRGEGGEKQEGIEPSYRTVIETSCDELLLTGDSLPPTKTKREVHASDKKKNKGTQAELEAYAEEIGLEASDGEFMFDHWEANGWRNGNAPVKDWRAGIRKWKAQGWLPSQKQVFSGRRNGNSNAHEQPMGI